MQRRRFLLSAALIGVTATFGAWGCSSDAEKPPTDEGLKADQKQMEESAAANDKAAAQGRRR